VTGRAGLRAGLIVGGVAIILAFLGLVPCLGCVTLPLVFAAYLAAGMLAVRWLPQPRSAGDGAAAGAVAGAVSGVLGGLALAGVSIAFYYMSGGADAIIQSLPSDTLQQLAQSGIDPYWLLGPTVYAVTSLVCGGFAFLAAIGLGAVAGAITAAATKRSGDPNGGQIIDA
jgi:hypothetical protein